MDPNEEKEAERRREEEGAVLVRLQVLNKAGRSLEGVMHSRAERGAPCTFRGNMNKRKMFLDLNEPVPEQGPGAARGRRKVCAPPVAPCWAGKARWRLTF